LSAPERPGRGRVRRAAVVAALVGLAVAAAIIAYVGLGNVVEATAKIGWRGLLALCLTYMIPMSILSTAWLVLDPEAKPSTWLTLFFARLVRDTSAEVLPFSSLGGFVFGARAAVLGGVEPALAISTTVVDVTAEFIGQLGFSALGVALLFYRPEAPPQDLLPTSVLGLAAGLLAAAAFIMLQRRASGPLERWVAGWAPSTLAQQGAVTASLHSLYQQPLRLMLSSLLHFAAWVFGAAAVWGALWMVGEHYSLRSIVGLESIVYVLRTVLFFVPMGLGVIEGGYASVCILFGLPPAFAVALSLMKRARDIAVGAPALALWFRAEGRRLLARSGPAAGPPAPNAS
jgi:putative membrane protein